MTTVMLPSNGRRPISMRSQTFKNLQTLDVLSYHCRPGSGALHIKRLFPYRSFDKSVVRFFVI
jgi:hypothetical protein